MAKRGPCRVWLWKEKIKWGSKTTSKSITGLTLKTVCTSSKTFFKPSWVKAEHSRYLTALIDLAMSCAFCKDTISKPARWQLQAICIKTQCQGKATSTRERRGYRIRRQSWRGLQQKVKWDFCRLPLVASSFIFSVSLRKSDLVPTKMMGTPGAWCWISGHHLALTFS